MIDTLARHIAALREARRLTGMVLANNGSFVALQAAQAAGDEAKIAEIEASLATDMVYLAFRLLEGAIAEITPPADPVPASTCLLDRISVIAAQVPEPPSGPDRAMIVQAAPLALVAPADTLNDAPISLGDRLQHVLELTAIAGEPTTPPGTVYRAQHDEARVSIVYRQLQPACVIPARPPSQDHPELIHLFR